VESFDTRAGDFTRTTGVRHKREIDAANERVNATNDRPDKAHNVSRYWVPVVLASLGVLFAFAALLSQFLRTTYESGIPIKERGQRF
jgi:hypothetical protein